LGLASRGIDRAWALTVPVVLVEGSELLCAFAGKTSVNAKKGTVSSLAEANGHMSRMR
jgi:hypothetical protein